MEKIALTLLLYKLSNGEMVNVVDYIITRLQAIIKH